MHHGGENADASFRRPVRRLRRFWRRADRRGRVLAAGAGAAGLSAAGAGLYALILATAASPASMAFHDYAAAVSAGKVAEVLVRPQEAEVVLHGGERRQVRAPLEWQPMARLAEAGVALRYEPASPDRLPTISSLLGIATILAFGAAWAFKMRDMTRSGRRYHAPDGAKGFADVAGQEEAKAELGDIVSFLRDPARFAAVGAKPCRGVLLYGPPGNGKTRMAAALAGEAGVPFLHASGSEFTEMFVGLGSMRVRRLFDEARKSAPCILFLDEIDALAQARVSGGTGGDREHAQTVAQLLTCMDGLDGRAGVVVIAATNLAETLDPALLRPGRFDRRVQVGRPTLVEREAILALHARGKPIAPEVDLAILAGRTGGMSGADLAHVVNEAAVLAARESRGRIEAADLEHAADRVLLGPERRSLTLAEEERRIVAVHEAGHALVALRTPGAQPLHKVTVMPRGAALGLAMQRPAEERFLRTRRQLLAELAVAAGGRAAEELEFGADAVTTGAAGDLRHVAEAARRMVFELGMGAEGEDVVFLAWPQDPRLADTVSQEGRARLEAAVEKLARGALEEARRVLQTHRAGLRALADALLRQETLDGEEAEAVVRAAVTGPALAAAD
ncbi:MAG: Cell division protein FtsH [uncultured Acetobacteraceae bacterium]|uniref:Cell division protein FtsH n=1 Tax=uncultured Acetobacteraceae bacterium TaxID=169975 RepID=A0A6J4IYD3_9PROT|nr:MAG: Cell division protein FtsH [uncultured Acetobacteraceae bacterium]